MSKKIVCVDIGSAKTAIYLSKIGVVYNQPTKISYDSLKKEPEKIGFDADKLDGKTLDTGRVISPFFEGKIYHFQPLEDMLKMIPKKVGINNLFKDSILVFPMSTNISKLDNISLKKIGHELGAKITIIAPSILLTALGLGIDFNKNDAHLIVDIGAGTAQIGVVCLNEIISEKDINFSSQFLDRAIKLYLRDNFSMIIGDIENNNLKIKLGSLEEFNPPKVYVVTGRDSMDYLPKQAKVNSNDIYKIYKKNFTKIAEIIISLLEELPTNFMKDIINNGIVLVGGISKLKGLKEFLREIFKLKIKIPEDPELFTVLGASKLEEYIVKLVEGSKKEDKDFDLKNLK